MKTRYGRLAIAFGALTVALSFVPNCAAQCGASPEPKALHKNSWFTQPGQIRLLSAAFKPVDDDIPGGEPSIVGLWHVKLLSKGNPGITDGTTLDAGYSQWHSDGTEILNSGSRAPGTGSFCLGIWEKVGEREYKLNHFAISWDDPTAKAATGPTNIREEVTLDRDGKQFTGSFTIYDYEEIPNQPLMLKDHVQGVITGTRIEVETPPQNIF